MKESFSPGKGEKKKEKNSHRGIRNTLIAGAAGILGALPSKAQNNPDVSFASLTSTSIEKTRTVRPTSDAKNIETAYFTPADSFEIKIANYFETDKADITPENEQKISETLYSYLSNLNQKNIEAFLASEVVLNVSCDPRRTNFEKDGKTGNYPLALARAGTAITSLQNAAAGFDFSKSGLTPEQIASAIAKFNSIKIEIPMTHAETGEGEDGVIDYRKIINFKTMKPYTDAEWQELQKPENEEKKLKAYEDFRYANLNIRGFNPKEPPKTIEKIPDKPFKLNGYKKLYILFDDSPSMEASKEYLATQLTDNETDIPVEIRGFTSKIDTSFSAKNINEAADVLKHIRTIDDNIEYGINAAETTLKEIGSSGEKILLTVCTDEELQGVSRDKLEAIRKLALGKNVDVEFSIAVWETDRKTGKSNRHTYNVPLAGIRSFYEKIFQEKNIGSDVEQMRKLIQITERELKEKSQQLASADNKKSQKEATKDIALLEDDLARYYRVMEEYQTINISDFR